MNIKEINAQLTAIKQSMQQVVVGKEKALDLMLIALLCRGHVLLEDVPGIGKTTMVSTLARSLGLSFNRIQFTPDVMPSDVTGFSLYNPASGKFEHHPGAEMSQLLLADEINPIESAGSNAGKPGYGRRHHLSCAAAVYGSGYPEPG